MLAARCAGARLKQSETTKHLPVIAFTSQDGGDLPAAARAAGVALIVNDAAILAQLPQILEQALHIE